MVNLCVCDKYKIIPSTESLCRCLGSHCCCLTLVAEPALLPEVKPALETSVVLGGRMERARRCLLQTCLCSSRSASAGAAQLLQVSRPSAGSPWCCRPGSRLEHVWICRCSASLSISHARVEGWLSCQGAFFFPHSRSKKWLKRICVQWQRLKHRIGLSTLKVLWPLAP